MSFPRYPEYKDSGVAWLGEVPGHWEVCALKRLLEIQNGSDHKHIEQAAGYPVIGSGGQFAYASDYLYDGESVLLGRKGTIDKPLYVTGKFWTVDTMYWSKIAPDACGRYAYYTALTIPFGYYSTNTALPSMTQGTLSAHIVARPPLAEQTAIATFLDRETAKIDALVAEQEKLIALLQEKRQAVISHAVTKGLDPNVPMKDSGVEWLGEVPGHWEILKVSHSFRARKGRDAATLTKEHCATIEGEYPVYSGQTENSGVMASISSFEFDTGNSGVLFSTTVGAKAMTLMHINGRFSLSQNCMIISASTDLDMRFYFYHFQPLFAYERGLIPEHMQASFRMEDLYAYRFARPSVNEQIEIARYLDEKCSGFDRLISESQKNITLLQERRTALISAAVTGQIDVRGLADGVNAPDSVAPSAYPASAGA